MRLLVGFGGAVLVFLLSKPTFHGDPISFWMWVLGVYLLTLIVETVLLTRANAPAVGLGDDPDGATRIGVRCGDGRKEDRPVRHVVDSDHIEILPTVGLDDSLASRSRRGTVPLKFMHPDHRLRDRRCASR